MREREPYDVALEAWRAGRPKGAVLAALRNLGLDEREAKRVCRRAHIAHLEDRLPDEWRKAGRKHAVIGTVALLFSLVLVTLAGFLIRAMYFSTAATPITGDHAVIMVCVICLGSVALSIGELAYARRLLVRARKGS